MTKVEYYRYVADVLLNSPAEERRRIEATRRLTVRMDENDIHIWELRYILSEFQTRFKYGERLPNGEECTTTDIRIRRRWMFSDIKEKWQKRKSLLTQTTEETEIH